MAAEIEVTPVVNAFDFLPAERKLVLDVERRPSVMGQLASAVLVPLELGRSEPEGSVPVHTPFPPALEPLRIGPGLHEELHLHLLELTRAKDEVARCNLVPE